MKRRLLPLLIALAYLCLGWAADTCPEGHCESAAHNPDGQVYPSTTTVLETLYGTAHKGPGPGSTQEQANLVLEEYELYMWWNLDQHTGADAGDEPVGHTHLSAGIDSNDTTLAVESTSSFPSSGFVLIGTEVIRYTSTTGNSLVLAGASDRGYNETSAASHTTGASVSHIRVWEQVVDAVIGSAGYEDFTGYTEVDPNSHITVTAQKLDVDGMTCNEDAYVYSDEGVNHFGATFTHEFAVTPRARTGSARAIAWAISNNINDAYNWHDNYSQAVSFELYASDTPMRSFALREYETRTVRQTGNVFWEFDTTYYITIERTGETTLDCRIYSDASRTQLLTTFGTLPIPSGRRYRYVFGTNSWNSGAAVNTFTFDVENLDMNENGGGGGYNAIGYDATGEGLDDGTEGDLLQFPGDNLSVTAGRSYLIKIRVVDVNGNTNTEVGGVDKFYSYGEDSYTSETGDATQGLEDDEVWSFRINARPPQR